MSATELLAEQIKEIRDEHAAMNRAIGSAFERIQMVQHIVQQSKQEDTGQIVGELNGVLNILIHGDMRRER